MTVRLAIPDITISGDADGFRSSWTRREVGDGVAEFDVTIEADAVGTPPVFTIEWRVPMVGIHARWHPGTYLDKGLLPDYATGFVANATALAPVASLYSLDNTNRLTFALSDALSTSVVRTGVNENTATMVCGIDLFTEPRDPFDRYTATLRVDARPHTYDQALADVARWWSELPGMTPSDVPERAREPLYSTWYSYHQDLTADDIERECRAALELGFRGVIVDDGWQTDGVGTGYLSCGDWEPAASKFPDMRAHVERVQALGMSYLLWFDVPHVGENTRAFERFKDQMLGYWRAGNAWVLDPRFPEVREHLVALYERCLREWGLDGFKVDFVDSFRTLGLENAMVDRSDGGRDLASVAVAVDTLLSDTIARLRAIDPDVMIEFRQSYIGPYMRKYGNMFRAADCPNDPLRNRVSILDLRALAGTSSVHADMLMWHEAETAENVALQFVNTLFGVPQVSVRLDDLSDDHVRVVRHWLAFGVRYRDVLLRGELRASNPQAHYPRVSARTDDAVVRVAYDVPTFELTNDDPPTAALVNGSTNGRAMLTLGSSWAGATVQIWDARGELVGRIIGVAGLSSLDIPVAGYAELTRGA
ncbi:glycoside hydrolase family 36 protein [Microbacterium sp.]|uniref:glycoside hydrolase family 36 protein n=1 Tax=Microbacterium sp. TaxID=51671 RepID=UPI003F7145D8